MVQWKQVAPVVLALVISLGVTVVFVTGMLSGGKSGEPVDIEQDENRTPSPATNATLNGTLTAEANEFASFKEGGRTHGLRYESTATSDASSDAGLYVTDYNNDGYEDLLAIGSDTPALFRNTGSAFSRVREFNHDDARTAHFFDYNNNGWRDLLIAEYDGSLTLYENNNGSFARRSNAVKDVSGYNGYPVSMTSADFTGNGCLDVFIGMYGINTGGTPPITRQHARNLAEDHPSIRPDPEPARENHLLYGIREDGECVRLADATDQAGISGKNWTYAASAVDFTGDGYIDIHVANDFDSDILYENTGNGSFKRHQLGPATDRNAMSSVVRDVNNDGRPDLFVTNIYFPESIELRRGGFDIRQVAPIPEGNNLLINQGGDPGEGLFTDTAPEHGLDEGGWGWAAVVEDFTNDGYLDVIHSTGEEVPLRPYERFQTPQVWQGTADSWKHINGSQLGLDKHQGRGIVSIDYNNDGALDLAVATRPFNTLGSRSYTGRFRLYENQLNSDEYLQLFVRHPNGIENNAAVLIETDKRTVFRRVNANGDYLSQNSRLIHLGTDSEKVRQVRVLWPSGNRSVYNNLQEGNRYVLTPDSAEPVE